MFTWFFLIFGPCFGVLSDRLDRRRTVVRILAVEGLLSVAVALLLRAGRMSPALMLCYMLASSVCMVLDTTTRPALVYDVLFAANAQELVGTAMALRSVGGRVGSIGGNQAIGLAVELAGGGNACLLVSCLLLSAMLLLCCVESPPKANRAKDSGGGRAAPKLGVVQELRAGVAMAWRKSNSTSRFVVRSR